MIRTFRTTLPATALGLACMTGIANAQDSGQMDLVIGESTYMFPVSAEPSGWSGSEDFAMIDIEASPADDATSGAFGPLTLTFEYTGGTVNNPEIGLTRILPDGTTQKLFSDDDASAVVVTVDRIEADGDTLDMDGNLSGTLGTGAQSGGTVAFDAPLSISGSFDVTLAPVG
jgi:hypothetical protein